MHISKLVFIRVRISPEFYFRCNNIVIDYFTRELESKMKDMEISEDQVGELF
jgi:hypothetical protein